MHTATTSNARGVHVVYLNSGVLQGEFAWAIWQPKSAHKTNPLFRCTLSVFKIKPLSKNKKRRDKNKKKPKKTPNVCFWHMTSLQPSCKSSTDQYQVTAWSLRITDLLYVHASSWAQFFSHFSHDNMPVSVCTQYSGSGSSDCLRWSISTAQLVNC